LSAFTRSIIVNTLLLLSIVLAGATSAQDEPRVFENDVVRWTIDSSGATKSLLEKNNGHDWARPAPVALVKKAGRFYAASAMTRQADLWRMDFGPSGVTIDLGITSRPHYFIVELVAIHGDGVEQVCLARIDSAIGENYGGRLNVSWNQRFAVGMLGLSDRVNTSGPPGWASVSPKFGMIGEKAALVAVPKPQFLEVVQEVERDCGLPSPKLGGQWAKTSLDVRRGYLFTDLTEANADETIRYARLGEFGCVMPYSDAWSASLGSYPINLRNFTRGEESLKAVIDKCHAAGLKVGMHMLSSLVGKDDPLVRPKPDSRLLKDAEAVLAADVDAAATELRSAGPLDGFSQVPGAYGDDKQGMTVVIDDEIIYYNRRDLVAKTLGQCARGYLGTKAAPHKAGAKIFHLCEACNCYLADLRTSLKDELAERVAGVFNRCGFDMIFFDGGECNMAGDRRSLNRLDWYDRPEWYWVSQQQMSIYQRIRREVLVQGSGETPWLWHIFARGTCDDFAAIAPKPWLDCHKIAEAWQRCNAYFMPAELGWWGFLNDAPDHPATSPDEVEYYAARMLALDTPVSLETNLAALKRNGRTEELFRLLGEYERLRLQGAVPQPVREKLRRGEWHLMTTDGKPFFHPIRYEAHRVVVPGSVTVVNRFERQPLRFRLQAVPLLAPPGDKANRVLLRADPPLELRRPEAKTPMPGAMAAAAVGLSDAGKPLNLLKHRALAVKLRVEGPAGASPQPCPVLNVQLEGGGTTYRDYYVDLDFRGEKTLILPEPTAERTLAEFCPDVVNYFYKWAMVGFDYGGIVALNLRWMRTPGTSLRCTVERVEALAESDSMVKNPQITVAGKGVTIDAALATGDYAEYWDDGQVRVFNRNGVRLKAVTLTDAAPVVPSGNSTLSLSAAHAGPVKFTLITLGKPVFW
jgi:hypothetical protein